MAYLMTLDALKQSLNAAVLEAVTPEQVAVSTHQL